MNGLEHLASELIGEYLSTRRYLRDNVERLAHLALGADEAMAQAATKAIFVSLIERLADSFDPIAVTLYNTVFAQLIEICRTKEPELDAALQGFGLDSELSLLQRAETIRRRSLTSFSRSNRGRSDLGHPAQTAQAAPTGRIARDDSRIEQIVVLSRVTIGADVAITSVLVERLKQKFPGREVVLAGAGKLTELFGGDPSLSFLDMTYSRAGSLLERLMTWLAVVRAVGKVTAAASGNLLVVDPDSRLTQLGMLPVTANEETNYLFFPSREYPSDGFPDSSSLWQLASDWSAMVLDGEGTCLPRVSISAGDSEITCALVAKLRAASRRPVVLLNFGAGENPNKQLGREFEEALVDFLLAKGATLILDRGATETEDAQAAVVLEHAKRTRVGGRGIQILDLDENCLAASLAGSPRGEDAYVDILSWRGRLGVMAGLIANSDLYIGYDSAGQHIAAALGVPCIDVFAGYTSRRMLERWRPGGPGKVTVIDAGTGQPWQKELAEVTRQATIMLERSN